MYPLYRKADVRQMITIKCSEGMPKQDLRSWWLERAELLKKLPGLKWYTVCFSFETSPFGPPAFDGYEELWFGSLKDLKTAYETETMQIGLEDIRKRGLGRPELFQAAWLEENIIPLKGYKEIPRKRGTARLTGICRLPPAMTKKALKDWFHRHAARVVDDNGYMIIPGIRWYTHCFALDRTPFGKAPFYGCAENWWDSLEAMKEDFEGEVMQSQLKDREDNIDIVDPSYFQGIWAEEHIIEL